MGRMISVTRKTRGRTKITYKTPDKGAPGKTPKRKRWYKPGSPSGWSKNDPADVRRKNTLRAHGGNLLSAARAKISLANVTADPVTKRLARQDADAFLRQYHAEKKRKATQG
jgi:hypothetical protein